MKKFLCIAFILSSQFALAVTKEMPKGGSQLVCSGTVNSLNAILREDIISLHTDAAGANPEINLSFKAPYSVSAPVTIQENGWTVSVCATVTQQ